MYRQPEAEAGADCTGQQLHLTTVVAGYAAHYGEAETGAAGTAIPALIQPHEGLEDLGRQRRIYARAVVGHLQQIVILLLAHGEGHPAGGVAQGVADEVLQRPIQQAGIAAPGQGMGGTHQVESFFWPQRLPVR